MKYVLVVMLVAALHAVLELWQGAFTIQTIACLCLVFDKIRTALKDGE